MTAFLTIFTTFIWPILKGFFGMALRFATTPGNWVVAGLAVAIAFGGGYFKGKRHQDRVWLERIDRERKKQESIIIDTDKKALAETARLNEELENANAHIVLLLAEADADAGAAAPSLGVNSVRRIRRSTHKP